MTGLKRPGSAILGGIVGTVVLSTLLFLLEIQTRSAIQIFDVIAAFVGVPTEPVVGFVLFAAAGSIAWPLLFVGLEPYLPRGPDPVARAVVFSTVLWVAFVILGSGGLGGPVLIIYVAFTLFAHWAYGFTLGLVYARFMELGPTERIYSQGESRS